ncbi:MAG TPA: chromosomal replication initiator protein DnaA [Pirellulaceae bacterium]|jgi:chromosomal replication initiator protein|nr:chromosomal replication initiator protein DnaA [Pirellulaceae bacterium]
MILALRAALIAQVGKERFDLWFEDPERVRLEEGRLVICAADAFSLDRLRKTFREEIEFVATKTLGRTPEIVFRVESAAERKAEPGASTRRADEPRAAGPRLASHASRSASEASGAAPRPIRGDADRAEGSSSDAMPRRKYAQLDEFVVGDGSIVAHTAANMCVQRCGQVSPVFFYGPNGSGKTHLLEGILAETRRRGLVRRAVYLSSEQFTTQFVDALRGSGLPNFRRKYRDVELLVLDDLQFFAGKRATIVELQHTLDHLLRAGRQIVLAADRPPSELNELGSELIARFTGGLVCGIELPERSARLRIVQRLAERRRMEVPAEVAAMIADHIHGDVRQIAGALNRLHAASFAMSRPVSVELATVALSDIFRAAQKVVRLPDVEKAICEVFGIDASALHSKKKSRTVSHPRMLAMWLSRKYTRSAFADIGEYFGNRTHSTVISAQKKVDQWVAEKSNLAMPQGDVDIQEVIRRLEQRLRAV